jgi:integrase
MPGHIKERKHKRKDGSTYKRWRARYPDPSGRNTAAQIERTFDTKRAAEAWLLEQAHAVQAGTHIDPRKAGRPFSEVVAAYKETRYGSLAPTTRDRYDSVLRKHLEPEFGRMGIGAVNRERVKRYFARLAAEGMPAGTVQKIHTALSAVLSEAVELDMARTNTAAALSLPAPEQRDMLFLTAQQVRQLADAMDRPQDGLAVYVAAYCGLRAGELWALRRMDVDTLHGRLIVRRSLCETKGKQVFKPPKNGKPRTIKLPKFLHRMLTDHLASLPGGTEALVFTGPGGGNGQHVGDGGPVRHGNFYKRVFKPTVVGDPENEDESKRRAPALPAHLHGLRWHDLRHTCASLLISTGAHPKAIQERLGHASITTTLDRYGHLMPGLADALAEALDDAHAAASPPDNVAELPPRSAEDGS